MLEEAVEVIRMLWRGGSQSHRGRHYRVENARIYDLPDHQIPILVSGFGPKSVALAARIGDGYCTVGPDKRLIDAFRDQGGGERPVHAGVKVCWAPDEATARRVAHRLWPNDGLPGELAQVLPTPAHFEQAATLVSEEMIAEAIPCGPDLGRHVEAIEAYAEAGVDELYVQQVGPEIEGFFNAYAEGILPRFRSE
jgi:G6PDH family F420-dependent oxidoreductase